MELSPKAPPPTSHLHSSDTLQLRKRKSRVGALEPWPHHSTRIQALLSHTQPRSQCCHVGGMERVQGAESPPQVVPRNEWHILRSQEMLCTAPAVIKHCCSPAAPQCIPCRPLTPQPLTYLPRSQVHSCANTPTRTLWEHPTYPQTHLYTSLIHTFPHLQHTLLHIHIPQPCPHADTFKLPVPLARVLSRHTHPQTHMQCPHPQRCTLTDTHTHVHSSPEHTPYSPLLLHPTPSTRFKF